MSWWHMTPVVFQLIGLSSRMFLILTFVLVMFGVVVTLYLTYVGHKQDIHSPGTTRSDEDESSG